VKGWPQLIKAPIVVDNRGDVILFEDVATMGRYMEAIDVRNAAYLAYDSEGRLISLGTTLDATRSHFGRLTGPVEVVCVNGVEDAPTHAQVLAAKIKIVLARVGPEAPPDASLEDLVHLLQSKLGFTK
jgi:hypothetical protein